MKINRRYVAIVIAAIAALLIIITRQPKEYRTASGVVWHTTYNITYESDKNLDDSIIVVTNKIDYSASMYNPASVLSQINSNSTNIADSTVALLLRTSKRIHQATGGAFDPTVAPLIRLWRTQDSNAPLPDNSQIDSVMQFVGLDKVRIDRRTYLLELDSPCAFLDDDGRCSVYEERFARCPSCRKMTLFRAVFATWLPPQCAYVQWARRHHIRLSPRHELILSIDQKGR